MVHIGDFAQLGGVSIRMLRHYDEIGLLHPTEIDRWTKRRKYGLDQLADLHRIVTLKALGFSLQQIREVLHDGVEAAELRGMLRMRRAEFERQSYDARHRMAQIDARLRLLEAGPEPQIVVKQVESTKISALTSIATPEDDFGDVVENLFIKACDLADSQQMSRTTPISWYVPEPGSPDSIRIYIGFAVPSEAMEIVEMPAVEVASVIHHGPMADIGRAYVALARWADGRNDDEPHRRRLVFLEANSNDQTDWVVDVQLELKADVRDSRASG